MKRFLSLRGLAALVLLAFIAPRAAAITYTGEIVGVATGGVYPFFEYYTLGETWKLQYAYDSDSPNGTFTLEPGVDTLRLKLMFGKFHADYSNTDPDVSRHVVAGITVVDGHVHSLGILAYRYAAGDGFWEFDAFGGGPVFVSNPVASSNVPDAVATAPLLLTVLLGLIATAWVHRRTPAFPAACQPLGR